jgi:hypothetical protein
MVVPQRLSEHGLYKLQARRAATTKDPPIIKRKEADKFILPDLPKTV